MLSTGYGGALSSVFFGISSCSSVWKRKKHVGVLQMDYNKLAGECGSLEDLFTLWREAHHQESEAECLGINGEGGTFPRKGGIAPAYEAFRDSFCPDGITSHAGREGAGKTCQVLFILIESNVLSQDAAKKSYGNQPFWFNVFPEDEVRSLYAGRLQQALQRLVQTQGLKQEVHEPYGYMNLNKRGGFGDMNGKPLRTYVNRYLPFIKRQIELLSPNYIVCCSCYDLLAKSLFGTRKHEASIAMYPQLYLLPGNQPAKVYYIYHPTKRNNGRFASGLNFIGQYGI